MKDEKFTVRQIIGMKHAVGGVGCGCTWKLWRIDKILYR